MLFVIYRTVDPTRRLPKCSNPHKQFEFTGMLINNYKTFWLALSNYCELLLYGQTLHQNHRAVGLIP
jgi:hypothetical protein